ncbi:MAG TPA: glycosyltransferase, partial [Syntrophorhabdaceae bacterium]|nr:glycosyltransferase [Syntrophorhabdaceae bacterium]
FTESETRWFQDLGVRNSVRYVAGDDSLLARCYSDARCYVCPSLYEGFGMPLVEAMGLGCPVICSSKGSIPEVAGDAAVYFDPQNVDSIQSVLESVVFDDIALDRVKGHGVERESQFSWEQSAIETFELYKSLIS